ncbi:MAG: hypothetical protein CENE_02557 [Candidatus Celerinatantimonas neptuna]|nr:MAG: hypothetical protein CENE_02557 [Candidatus Celerinatantimonas neptuna]
MGCVVWQVIARYILGSPSTTTDELSRFLFFLGVLISAVYASGQKVYLLFIKMSGIRKINRNHKLYCDCAFSTIVMIYGGTGFVERSLHLGQISPVLGIQMGYVYLAISISGFAKAFYNIIFLIKNIKSICLNY